MPKGSGKTLDNYTTFLLPSFVDSRMLIVWIASITVALFLILFFIWKSSPKLWLPKLAGVLTMIGIILIPVAYFGTPFYNTKVMADHVAQDYGVDVTLATNYTSLVVLKEGQAYKCEVNSKDMVRYYVLCDVPEGRLLLDTIKPS
jgi:hypothetical protein